MRLALLLALAATPAWGQFQLYLVNGSIVQPVVRTYDLGSVPAGKQGAATFRIVNTSAISATLNLLTVTGSGFSVSSANAPKLPVLLAPQQSLDFTVLFQGTAAGLYTGALNSVGIAIGLTATVPLQMTYQWVNGQAAQSLAAGPVTFGSVPVGQSPTIQVLLLNQTSAILPVPALSLSGAGFALASQPLPGATVMPSGSTSFEIQFSPKAAGTFVGTLTIGAQTFVVTGTGIIPALPQPSIAVSLAQSTSAQQGTIAVNLSATAQTSASGTVALSFVPDASIHAPADTGIALSSGGQSTSFNVFIGQKQAAFGAANSIGFQTGTTAGTLTVSVTLGGYHCAAGDRHSTGGGGSHCRAGCAIGRHGGSGPHRLRQHAQRGSPFLHVFRRCGQSCRAGGAGERQLEFRIVLSECGGRDVCLEGGVPGDRRHEHDRVVSGDGD